jgi:putative tryptophan/tyrosine transport system substrate-binding protein
LTAPPSRTERRSLGLSTPSARHKRLQPTRKPRLNLVHPLTTSHPTPIKLIRTRSLSGKGHSRALERVATSFKVSLTTAGVHNADEIKRSIDEFAREANSGLIVLPQSVTATHHDLIVTLANQYRLPAIYPYRFFVHRGGLISYGIDMTDQFERAALYVHRILLGEKPADLPVQAPTRFNLVINLKTAKALGLEVPLSLLVRVDEVVE